MKSAGGGESGMSVKDASLDIETLLHDVPNEVLSLGRSVSWTMIVTENCDKRSPIL
jgi:hypothetical protein